MWEIADAGQELPPPNPSAPHGRSTASGYDTLLWAQILLCALIAAGVFAARRLNLPLYERLRADYALALAQPGPELWNADGTRRVVRFTQEALAGLRGEWQQGSAAATAETARRPHGRTMQTSTERYLPDFALTFPLPNRTVQTSGYGTRTDPVGGAAQEFHTGADLSAAEGTPVYAAADGVVRLAETHESYGNYLRILHADGDETIYAHLQYLFVHPGQQVAAGQQVGTVGQTGNATGPHLHFELLHQGVRYDPAQALANAG